MLPPAARKGRPADSIPAKHLHSSLNKARHPVNVVSWTPEGRRLLTGSASGEFTLWNGTGFNFETIMQAHESAVRQVAWSHNDEWLLSADQDGWVIYYTPTLKNINQIRAHTDPVRDLCFSPTDAKFVTAADDATLKIWDFATSTEESVLTGHQWDAKCVDWHPTKGLLVSGSKDHQVKLWDPRTGRCLTTLHGHKNTISKTLFEPTNGVLLASCARDMTARIFDLRMMRDVFLLRGNEKEITSLVWHPIHSSLLTTGANDGAIMHYILDEQHSPPGTATTLSPYDSPNPADAPAQTIYPAHATKYAHEFAVWSMAWHPLGHILATGSNDRATRFWTRPRPGETSWKDDRWHIGQAEAEKLGTYHRMEAARQKQEEEAEMEDEAEGLVDQQMPSKQSFLPGLPGITAPMPGLNLNGNNAAMSLPGFNSVPPPLFPTPGGVPPPLPPGMDLERFKEIVNGHLPVPLMPPQNGTTPPGFPPPGFPLPPGFPGQLSIPPPQDFVPPPGFLLPGMPSFGQPGPPRQQDNGAGGANSVRKRAPLPSQQDSLRAEMQQGRYTKPR